MKKDIRVIALDLDYTLLDTEKRISPANYRALEEAAAAGIEIVPCTGRFFDAMPEAVRSLPFMNYAITINGATIIDARTRECIYKAEIPTADALDFFRFLDGLPVLYDCYAGGKGFMTKAMYDLTPEFIEDRHALQLVLDTRTIVPELKAFIEEGGLKPQKLQLFTKDKALRARLLEELPERFPGFAVTSSLPHNIEINDIETDKGKALLRLAAGLGYSQEQTMAFGDGLNDISMIRMAGLGVAMGNAHPDVKKAAGAVTDDCDHDGVAKAIYEFVL